MVSSHESDVYLPQDGVLPLDLAFVCLHFARLVQKVMHMCG